MSDERRVKTDRLIVFGILALVVLLTAVYSLLQRTEEFSWQYVTNTVLFSFLGVVNLILILSLLVILFRNLIKLLIERHRNILGSRFRTKLVFTVLGLCLIPSVLLFAAALSIIERSLDRWFSSPVEKISEDARTVVDAFYEEQKRRTRMYATDIAEEIGATGILAAGRPELLAAMEDALRVRRLDLVSVYKGSDQPLTVAHPRTPVHDLNPIPAEILKRGLEGNPFSWQVPVGPGQLVVSGAPIMARGGQGVEGVALAGTYVRKNFSAVTARLAGNVDAYRQLRLQKTNIKRVYKWGFGLITLLILVSGTWVGLYLARGITVPIQRLAEATREISTGNLDYRVELDPADELGILVSSFNRMTRELKSNRETIEDSNKQLHARNAQLEERRRYIETVLESIPSGVVSLDGEGKVSTINRAARRILRFEGGRDPQGLLYSELFGRESLAEVGALIPRLLGSHGTSLNREFHISLDGQPLSLSVTFSPLDLGDGQGLMIVVEDITSLIKAQKVAAWREVARRIAHEIKNPLTPIQLSAQRILKKWRENADDLDEAVEQGATTIVEEVKTLKSLVNEFSGFARMPASRPTEANLHEIIDAAVGLYEGTHQGVSFETDYDRDLPPVRLDKEQMKRVFINLIDNALQAMGRKGEISIGTRYLSELQMMQVEVSDDGPGIAAEDKEKLFLPYFSTRKRGTGLGLAIVNRIISDHHGYIRVEDNRPRGTKFIIDLPAA